jgi:hypothetical protein
MEQFRSILDLISGLKKLNQEEWIHADVEIWVSDPQRVEFYYLSWDYMQRLEDHEVFVNDDGLELPFGLKDKNLNEWMLVNVLTHIADTINWKMDGVKEFIDQVNFYREFDTFKR